MATCQPRELSGGSGSSSASPWVECAACVLLMAHDHCFDLLSHRSCRCGGPCTDEKGHDPDIPVEIVIGVSGEPPGHDNNVATSQGKSCNASRIYLPPVEHSGQKVASPMVMGCLRTCWMSPLLPKRFSAVSRMKHRRGLLTNSGFPKSQRRVGWRQSAACTISAKPFPASRRNGRKVVSLSKARGSASYPISQCEHLATIWRVPLCCAPSLPAVLRPRHGYTPSPRRLAPIMATFPESKKSVTQDRCGRTPSGQTPDGNCWTHIS